MVQRRLLIGLAHGAGASVGQIPGLGREVKEAALLQAHVVEGHLGVAGLLQHALRHRFDQGMIHRQAHGGGRGLRVEGQVQIGINVQRRGQRIGKQHLVHAIGRRGRQAALVLEVAQHKTLQVKMLRGRLIAHSELKSSPNRASS